MKMKILNVLLLPFKIVYDFIKFVIKDIVSDVKFLWTIRKRKPNFWNDIKLEIKEQFEMYSYQKFKDDIKKAYMWYIIIILAFFCGAFIAGKYYEMKCNNIIYEEYIKNDPFDNITFYDESIPTENGSEFNPGSLYVNQPEET